MTDVCEQPNINKFEDLISKGKADIAAAYCRQMDRNLSGLVLSSGDQQPEREALQATFSLTK